MAETQENEWTPGIVVLKDVALYEPGIERLGPPPGNAGVLIRGGQGWIFDHSAQIPAQGIVRLDEAPTPGEVRVALAREMAWRWHSGRLPGKRVENEKPAVRNKGVIVRYADIEANFVDQFLSLSTEGFGASWLGEPATDGGMMAPRFAGTSTCSCIAGTSCCASGCAACSEG